MPTYSKYYFSWKEKLLCLIAGGGSTGVIAWLFYRSIYAMVLFPVCLVIVGKELRQHFQSKREQELRRGFQGMLQIVSGLLKAGYSIENAFQEGVRDFAGLYGKECVLYREWTALNHRLEMNISIEKLLEDLAQRTELEEIESFSQVFGFAKRGGGDIVRIFQDSAEKIAERAEVRREIETVIAAKRLEQKIMLLVPCGILVYIRIGMPEFLSPLYENAKGVLIMSLCLGIYGIACKMAQRIVEIQV